MCLAQMAACSCYFRRRTSRSRGQRFFAMFLSFQSSRRIKELMKEMTNKEFTIAAQQNEIAELQKYTALPSRRSDNRKQKCITRVSSSYLTEEDALFC